MSMVTCTALEMCRCPLKTDAWYLPVTNASKRGINQSRKSSYAAKL